MVIGSELSGQRLTRVNVNVGDQVKRGQVLAEINSDTIRADLAASKASYAEAQAVLADAAANLKRVQQLKILALSQFKSLRNIKHLKRPPKHA